MSFAVQVDQTFDVRGVGSVLSGTVLSGQISLGQQLWLGPAEIRLLQRCVSHRDPARAGASPTISAQQLLVLPGVRRL